MTSAADKKRNKLTVFYDGSCPLCSSEISYFKRMDTDQALNCVDVSSGNFSGDDRINRSEAMERFHVRFSDGQQVSGAQAFVAVWNAVPSWRWLARLASVPGAALVLEGMYRFFLRIRPGIVRLFNGYRRLSGRT